MDRSRDAAYHPRAGGDTVQQNILPTVATDAPVLDQLARNLVPPLAAAGQQSRRSAERIWRLSRHDPFRRGEQRLNFFAGAYGSSWSKGEGSGSSGVVSSRRRDGVFRPRGGWGGFVGGAEDRVPRSAGRRLPGLHRKAMDLRCRSGTNAFLILIASCS